MKKINRIIGYLDEDGSLIEKQFSLHSSILFGTSEQVIETLEWVKEAYPENDWKIFTLCEFDDKELNRLAMEIHQLKNQTKSV